MKLYVPEEIKKCVSTANKAYFILQYVFKSKAVSRDFKNYLLVNSWIVLRKSSKDLVSINDTSGMRQKEMGVHFERTEYFHSERKKRL